MKKLISMLLVAVVLFNFIWCNQNYATTNTTYTEDDPKISSSDLESLVEEGKSKYKGEDTKLEFTPLRSLIGTIANLLARFFNLFPKLIQLLMWICCGQQFSIEKTVFGEIAVFDVDYFNLSDPYEYTIGTGEHEKTVSSEESAPISLRQSIAKFYYILRLFAAAISLLILIYVGIRMALATVADDKAKYKKMLIAWVESILILFLMQYIIAAIFGLGKLFENIIYNLKELASSSGDVGFETYISDQLSQLMLGRAGWQYVMYSLIFWVLVGIQTKFFILYFKRLITVGFLILISPMITITYPIDKIGDGKAQAFSVWMNELMMNVFIQPIHGVIYLVFMFTAGEIAKKSAWVALIFLLALTKIEKIILKLFDLRKVTSLKPIDEQRKD